MSICSSERLARSCASSWRRWPHQFCVPRFQHGSRSTEMSGWGSMWWTRLGARDDRVAGQLVQVVLERRAATLDKVGRGALALHGALLRARGDDVPPVRRLQQVPQRLRRPPTRTVTTWSQGGDRLCGLERFRAARNSQHPSLRASARPVRCGQSPTGAGERIRSSAAGTPGPPSPCWEQGGCSHRGWEGAVERATVEPLSDILFVCPGVCDALRCHTETAGRTVSQFFVPPYCRAHSASTGLGRGGAPQTPGTASARRPLAAQSPAASCSCPRGRSQTLR